MRIRMKVGARLLLAVDLLLLVGTASLLLFAWSLLDGTYYQYMQRIRFEKEFATIGCISRSADSART